MSGDLAPPVTSPSVRRDPTTRPALRGWLVVGIAVVGFLLAALVVSSYLGAAFGVQTALLALAVALVPLGIVIPTFLWLDRFESAAPPRTHDDETSVLALADEHSRLPPTPKRRAPAPIASRRAWVYRRRPVDRCPLDGTSLEPHEGGLDLAVHQTLAHGGTVWAVRSGQDLQPVEGIGALLRY